MHWQSAETFARSLDDGDSLRHFRQRFFLPTDNRPLLYFCGHSLGLQPRTVASMLQEELEAWASLGVEAHFHGAHPWYSYHEQFRDSGARLVGARPGEVVMMNSLTVNLHLMMLTFFQPQGNRCKILTDEPTFPSDLYALQSQLVHHRLDPAEHLLTLRSRPGETLLRLEDIEEFIERHGHQIALVLLNGVNYLTGQFLDIGRITVAAHRQGCVVGWDLAHAAGNVPLQLHDWQVDFAVWCSYKYLNAGPGAVAGCFVHETHGHNLDLPRLAGWWGNDPATRFQMHLQDRFVPQSGAAGWQLSNPPILAMVPLRASLDIFDEAGMAALRTKSVALTGYLEYLVDRLPAGSVELLTPRRPEERGCALSLRIRDRGREVQTALQQAGIVCDFRPPDVIRVAPVPLYNTFQDVWTFAQKLGEQLR